MPTALATKTLQAVEPNSFNVRSRACRLTSRPRSTPKQRRIVAELGQLGFTLRGTITTRTVTCGRTTCRCASDPDQRHGPYIQWSRTVKGRTVNKMLTPQQLETYQPWIDSNRRLRELAHQFESLSLAAVRTGEGWNHYISRSLSAQCGAR